MLTTTQAIILASSHTIDGKTMLRVLTQDYGRVDCLLYGAHSKRTGHKSSQVFPLSLVAITMDFRPSRDLQIIKDISQSYPIMDIIMSPVKSGIAMFVGEVLSKAIHRGDDDRLVFDFCYNSVIVLESVQEGMQNFHIAMLVRLAAYLGVFPSHWRDIKYGYYDLQQNTTLFAPPTHQQFLIPTETSFLRHLLRINYRNMSLFVLSRAQRRDAIDKILLYYSIHIPALGEISSRKILEEYFDF